MRLRQLIIVTGIAWIVGSANVFAEVVTHATVGGGYQGNLFSDSSQTGDRYGTFGSTVSYYPSNSMGLYGAAQYDAFVTYQDLSNLSVAVSGTFIPTPESSALTLGLKGNVSARKFGTLYEVYDQIAASVGPELTWQLSEMTRMRSSFSFATVSYPNSAYGSNQSMDLSAELNTTLIQAYSLTLRADVSRRVFDQPVLASSGSSYSQLERTESSIFDYAGMLVRIARPLSASTGIYAQAGGRVLRSNSDSPVPGYTIDYLSPWADLWQGVGLSAGVKHFISGRVITEMSFSYYDKKFLDVVESSSLDTGTLTSMLRHDKLMALSLTVTRPITLVNDRQLMPSVRVGYENNRSSVASYKYDNFSVALSVRIAL